MTKQLEMRAFEQLLDGFIEGVKKDMHREEWRVRLVRAGLT